MRARAAVSGVQVKAIDAAAALGIKASAERGLSNRIFVGWSFGALRLVVVMARRGRDERFAFRVACRIGKRLGYRRSMHVVVHERPRREERSGAQGTTP
jgi:hypothetical protein